MAGRTSRVVMLVKSRGQEIGDVVSVTPERAKELVAAGHARKPEPGEVKAAEGK